jgi:hypothetical protein
MNVQRESRVSSGPVRWAVLGAFAFAVAQVSLLITAPTLPDGPSSPGWFLNSGTNALPVGVVVALVAAAVSLRKLASIRDIVFLGVGAVLAMVATLFVIGRGTIFPIAIVFGACFLGLSVTVGGTCGVGVRALRRHAA